MQIKSKIFLKAAALALLVFPFITMAGITQAPVSLSTNNAASASKGPSLSVVPLQEPQITSIAPNVNALGYVLMDAYSGQVLAAKNPDQRMAPASLTKMMTSYIVSDAIKKGRIHMTDLVPISKEAWQTGGSKMFVKVNDRVPVSDLMQGMIVDSGNDACVAMAEFVAGSQEGFVSLMNQTAARLGMTGTHFMDVNGLPDAGHYTTPRDMAILGRALIFDFPEDYQWYSQKWFTYNGIKQANRNRLLWRDASVDGIKTGHTNDAGYCLVASAQRNNMRLISVVMGAPNDASRADDSMKLLTYGFRFFESHKLYAAGTELTKARVFKGQNKVLPVGAGKDIYITIPTGQYGSLKGTLSLDNNITAPVLKGQSVGKITITLNGSPVSTVPLVALQDNLKGSVWQRMSDLVFGWM